MTEPNRPRPVPGPPRPGSSPTRAPVSTAASGLTAASGQTVPDVDQAVERPFADLDERPVADHVAAFEAEHSRLQRELGTIDQL
ncbi:MAG: hypothetical protein JWQ45_2441 [Blastococcus sp.]|jgi:phage-related baseplate assembly protein|nr:hypothetical protein [Blastococcus sp.]